MVKIGRLKLGKKPVIALSVSDVEDNNLIKKSGADLLEIRLDAFKRFNNEYITKCFKDRRKTGLPVILTIRKRQEGGRVTIPDSKRLFLFSSLIGHVDAVDIELESGILSDVIKLVKRNKKTLIISKHNFKATPKSVSLEDFFKKAKSSKADIIKIATKANSKNDVLRLMMFTLKHNSEHVVTISLGKVGSISRIYFPLCGSLVSYTYLKSTLAPGQVPLGELLRQFRLYY